MDIVFEGSLSKNWGMKDVLNSVLKEQDLPWSMLRISSAGSPIQGKILISNCQYVVAAFCTGSPHDVDPYEALRTTLAMSEGTFAFLALTEKEAANFDHSLYIAVDRLMESITELPTQSTDLFDEKGLLDRIFGNRANQLLAEDNEDPKQGNAEIDFSAPPTESTVEPVSNSRNYSTNLGIPGKSAEEVAFTDLAFNRAGSAVQCLRRSAEYPVPKIDGPAPQLAPIAAWNMLEPFIETAQTVSGVRAAMVPAFSQTAAEQRISLGRLRSLPNHANGKFTWQRMWYELRALQWLPLFLFIVGLASFIAPQIWPTGGNDGWFRQEKIQEAATPAAQVH